MAVATKQNEDQNKTGAQAQGQAVPASQQPVAASSGTAETPQRLTTDEEMQYKRFSENTFKSLLMGAARLRQIMFKNEQYVNGRSLNMESFATSAYFYGESGTKKGIESFEQKKHTAQTIEIARALRENQDYHVSLGNFHVLVQKATAEFGIDEDLLLAIIMQRCASISPGMSNKTTEEKMAWFKGTVSENPDIFSKFPGGPAGVMPSAYLDTITKGSRGDPNLKEFIEKAQPTMTIDEMSSIVKIRPEFQTHLLNPPISEIAESSEKKGPDSNAGKPVFFGPPSSLAPVGQKEEITPELKEDLAFIDSSVKKMDGMGKTDLKILGECFNRVSEQLDAYSDPELKSLKMLLDDSAEGLKNGNKLGAVAASSISDCLNLTLNLFPGLSGQEKATPGRPASAEWTEMVRKASDAGQTDKGTMARRPSYPRDIAAREDKTDKTDKYAVSKPAPVKQAETKAPPVQTQADSSQERFDLSQEQYRDTTQKRVKIPAQPVNGKKVDIHELIKEVMGKVKGDSLAENEKKPNKTPPSIPIPEAMGDAEEDAPIVFPVSTKKEKISNKPGRPQMTMVPAGDGEISDSVEFQTRTTPEAISPPDSGNASNQKISGLEERYESLGKSLENVLNEQKNNPENPKKLQDVASENLKNLDSWLGFLKENDDGTEFFDALSGKDPEFQIEFLRLLYNEKGKSKEDIQGSARAMLE